MTVKKLKHITIFSLVFFISSATLTCYALSFWQPIKPGEHVYDFQRHSEQMMATAHLMIQVVNSIEKIRHQLSDLLNLGNEASVQELNINSQLNDFAQISDESAGMMNKNISADMVFDDVFKIPTDDELKSEEYQKNHQAVTAKFLEDTCKDLLKLAYATQNTSYDDAEFLRKMLDLNANVSGNLAGKQIENILLAAQIRQQIQSEQLDGAIAAVKIAKTKAGMFTENIAERKNRNIIVLSYDPYNPTAEDKQNYQHKPSPGFMKFK